MNYKEELRQRMYCERWDIEATFTFAEDVHLIQAERTIRIFWLRVSKEQYGKALRKHGKKVEQMTFYEFYSDGTNVHTHSILKVPQDRFNSTQAYMIYLRRKWRTICGTNIIIKINHIRQDQNEWIRYITKKVGNDNCDTLDLHSSYIAPKIS